MRIVGGDTSGQRFSFMDTKTLSTQKQREIYIIIRYHIYQVCFPQKKKFLEN